MALLYVCIAIKVKHVFQKLRNSLEIYVNCVIVTGFPNKQ